MWAYNGVCWGAQNRDYAISDMRAYLSWILGWDASMYVYMRSTTGHKSW